MLDVDSSTLPSTRSTWNGAGLALNLHSPKIEKPTPLPTREIDSAEFEHGSRIRTCTRGHSDNYLCPSPLKSPSKRRPAQRGVVFEALFAAKNVTSTASHGCTPSMESLTLAPASEIQLPNRATHGTRSHALCSQVPLATPEPHQHCCPLPRSGRSYGSMCLHSTPTKRMSHSIST